MTAMPLAHLSFPRNSYS